MNPPGKALKRGASYSGDPTPPALPQGPDAYARGQSAVQVASAPVVQVEALPAHSVAAPIFRAFAVVLLVAAGLTGLWGFFGEGGRMAIFGVVGCFFWAALMFAIAEALIRLAEISLAVRRMAEK